MDDLESLQRRVAFLEARLDALYGNDDGMTGPSESCFPLQILDDSDAVNPCPFDILSVEDNGGYYTVTFEHCIFQREQALHVMGSASVPVQIDVAGGECVWICADGSGEELASGSRADMVEASMGVDTIIPLYEFDNAGEVALDFRNIPHAQEWQAEFSEDSADV